MSTVYAAKYTLCRQTVPLSPAPQKFWGGLVKAYRDKYEALALASGSSIFMFRPAKGLVWNGRGHIISDNIGNAATLAVGTGITGAAVAAVTDKFLAATTHGSAATRTELGPVATIDAHGYEFDGETDVIITTGTGEAGGTIELYMEFM